MKAKFSLSKNPEIKAIFKINAVVSEQYVEKIYERIDEVQTHVDETNERIDDLYEIKADKEELSEAVDNLNLKITANSNAISQEISDRQTADVQIRNSISDLDEKVDGINVNLTRQIDDLEQDVNDKYNELVRDIDDLTDVVEEDYATLDTKINTTSQTINTRITNVADELNQTIEENVISLQQEDSVLQNQINTHSQTLTNYNTRITNNSNSIAQEIANRQNADNAIIEAIDGKQDTLISGQNIKTINNESILGAGNIDIQGGGAGSFAELEGSPYDNTNLKNALDSKQPTGNYALSTDIPTKVGQLQNDSGYITQNYHDSTKQDSIDDLAQIRDNASTGAGLAPQVAVNTQRIEDLTVAKFPNAVIIGTPHIEGGQVSNLSATSYLQFPFVDISRGQPFDIYFSFTTTNDITTQQNVLDSYFGIALAVQNGKGVMALSSNGSSWDIGTSTGTNNLQPNTTYYVKYSWTGTEYNASLSLDDQTYVPDMVLASNKSPYKTTIFIGGSPNLFGPNTAHPFKGTINFNKSKVVVNNIVVWEGMADVGLASRANVSLNNLDDVGEARFNEKANEIDLTTHTSNDTIHVTVNDKNTWNNKANDGDVIHKANAETIPGVKTFNGGKIATGAQPSLIATNGFYAGGYNVTGWADISCHRLCDNKINTGSYYINSDGSIIFRHKTGTSTAEGSANDAILTIHPVSGIKAGFAGTAGGTATQNDVLIDTITYNKLTTNTKDVLGAVNELNDKIKEIELFKFPNALIIGEPTINNGQISNFSQTSYLALPFLFDVHDRGFELHYAFRTGDDITTPQNLFGSNYCIASYIADGKLTVRVSNNSTSWNALDIITDLDVRDNTTYYIKLVFNRLNYTILASTNGTDYSQIGYKVTTEQPHIGEVYIGIGNNKNNPFKGIINLNKWLIKLNNAVIWQGMDDAGLATRADISLSNLDEQGEAKLGTQVIIRSW